MSFSHLHVHTTYSMFDGLATVDELFQRAEVLGQKGLAITDHGTMSGVPEFLRCAKRHPSVKPVIGCEMYLASGGKQNYHLILLAKNLEGYRNLVRLCSEAGTVGMESRPRATHAMLEKYHEGLIAMSACIGGEIPQAILSGNMNRARELIRWYRGLYGDDFYLEVSSHPSCIEGNPSGLMIAQDKAAGGISFLAEEAGIKVVATNDVHFVQQSDAEAHDVLLCIRTKTTMSDPDRFSYTGEEYLKSEEEMRELFPQEYLDNTDEVLSKIEIYDICQEPEAPDFPIPEGFTCADDYLASIAREGLEHYWEKRGESCPEGQMCALDQALRQASRKGWSNYFLIVWDLVRSVREKGYMVGPGKGSTADSVLNLALGITQVDPDALGLLHSRFVSDSRKILPDIALDMDSEGYEYAKQYLRTMYQEKNAVSMVMIGKSSHRTALKECFRAYGLDESRLEPIWNCECMKRQYASLRNCLQHDEVLRSWYESASEAERRAFDMEDKIRHHITCKEPHSSAVLLSRKPMMEYLPVEKYSDGEKAVVMSQYDEWDAEECGVLRLDLLRLQPLDVLRLASRSCCIPEEPVDAETLDIFRKGDTVGIFMFEPKGMREYLKELAPQSFTDLVALDTLYRPGLMEKIPQFCDAAHAARDEGLIGVPVMGLERILSETYGLLIYQEQLMQIAIQYGGFTGDEADCLRKAAGKKQTVILNELEVKFADGAMKRGIPKEDADKLWHLMTDNGWQLFIKAHPVGQVMISCRLAYLKAHHPEAFYKASVSAAMWDEDRMKLIDDARAHGILMV